MKEISILVFFFFTFTTFITIGTYVFLKVLEDYGFYGLRGIFAALEIIRRHCVFSASEIQDNGACKKSSQIRKMKAFPFIGT